MNKKAEINIKDFPGSSESKVFERKGDLILEGLNKKGTQKSIDEQIELHRKAIEAYKQALEFAKQERKAKAKKAKKATKKKG